MVEAYKNPLQLQNIYIYIFTKLYIILKERKVKRGLQKQMIRELAALSKKSGIEKTLG